MGSRREFAVRGRLGVLAAYSIVYNFIASNELKVYCSRATTVLWVTVPL